MPDNLFLGPQAGVNHSLALLRALSVDLAVQPDLRLVPGITFTTDPEATLRGRLVSPPGAVLSLHLDPQDNPRWISLVMDMGVVDLTAPQWLGVVAAVQSPRSVTFRVLLRSTIDGGHVDSYFRKTVVAYAEPTTHTDVLDVTRDQTVPRAATRRELILLFEHLPQDLHILNFGVFVA